MEITGRTKTKIDSVLTTLGLNTDEVVEVSDKLMNAISLDYIASIAEIINNTPEITNLPLKEIETGEQLKAVMPIVVTVLEGKGVDGPAMWNTSVNSSLNSFLEEMDNSVDAQVMANVKASIAV